MTSLPLLRLGVDGVLRLALGKALSLTLTRREAGAPRLDFARPLLASFVDLPPGPGTCVFLPSSIFSASAAQWVAVGTQRELGASESGLGLHGAGAAMSFWRTYVVTELQQQLAARGKWC